MNNKIISGLLLGCSVVGLTSCHDDLNIVQPSQFTSQLMWTNENDVSGAVSGLFTQFRSCMSDGLMTYGDLRSNLYKSGTVNDAYFNRIGTQNLIQSESGSNWSSLYTVVNTANLILKHLDDVNYTIAGLRESSKANALFVRAYCYYTIARTWGDAPLLLQGYESDTQDDIYPSRTPASELFAQIEADLEEAISIMPNAKNLHKGSKGSINMLRADYYLWKAARLGGGQAAYQKALDAANAVIGGGYSLLGNFADVFNPDNESNSEFIFTFPYNEGENVTPGGYPNYFSYYLVEGSSTAKLAAHGYTQDDIPSGSHAQYVAPTDEYLDFLLADPNDVRGAVSVMRFTDEYLVKEIPIDREFVKFKGTWKNETRVFENDMPVYRLAEAYLLKAEALLGLGDLGGAMDAINVVAKRARGVDNYYKGLDKDGVMDALIDESKMEFACEGKFWWLFLRTNTEFKKISTLVGRENELNITLWPVAEASINQNPNIEQTKGWFGK